jgi:type II secretory pathway pseudopilin PulG
MYRSVMRVGRSQGAFTLIELLTVVAIIMLLIGILVPSLQRARLQAKNTSTLATLKALGDGLELFRGDNEAELRGSNYPASAAADDPTEDGDFNIFGAQWLVRYLLGKDLNGYVSPRTAPAELVAKRTTNPENWQKDWYSDVPTADNQYAPLERVGPYVDPSRLKISAPGDLDGAPTPGFAGIDEKCLEQLVILDIFGYPILYYAANAAVAQRPYAPLATYDGTQPGIYNFTDNVLFTGRCKGTSCDVPPWDLAAVGGAGIHEIEDFGTHTNDIPTRDTIDTPDNQKTFPYYILDKDAFESTKRRTVMPHRRDSFILISAGADGRYGTNDDVTNF